MWWNLTTPRLEGVLLGDGGCEDLDIEIVSFAWEGMSIINPWMSECSRFDVTPEHYGFTKNPGELDPWKLHLDNDHVIYVHQPNEMNGRSHILLYESFKSPARLHYSVTAGAGMTDFKKEN